MAAGGGGAWKVAYADFVTAMMAFFLVMWIVGQDQKVRKSVADYFSDPMSGIDDGSGRKPNESGILSEASRKTGKVPNEETSNKRQGSNRLNKTRNFSEDTKLVHDWLCDNDRQYQHWLRVGSQLVASAAWSDEVRKEKKTKEDVAARILAKQMEEELRRDLPASMHEVHRNILLGSLAKVNWKQIAQLMVDPKK